MKFVDINTFYYASDGGVKTFYNAKINWFKNHPEHEYYLVYPNTHYKVEKIAPNITTVQVYGLKGLIGKNRLLMLDYIKVLKLLRKVNPDVVEMGDPLLTPIAGRYARNKGVFDGMLSSFHHSDPINTYINPWAYGNKSNIFKRFLARLGTKIYLANHRPIPVSMVASRTLKTTLEKMGIKNIQVKPFGVQDIFSETSRIRKKGEKHLLFAGRLEHEKGIHLLKRIVPRLLEREDVHITVMGKGAHENYFKNYGHPRLSYLGYIADREKVASIYAGNSIFLAPGPFETFGIGVLEAMTNGMIVVGPDQGGTGEFLKSMDSPFIFKADDTEAFYNVVMGALESAQDVESKRSIDKAADFQDWGKAIQSMIDFYINQVNVQSLEDFDEKESPDLAA
jgi:alpha-1,6-mannosyltransferase